MNNINDIYEMMKWGNPANVRSEGFRLAKTIKDLSLLIMPPAPAWEACAQVLFEKSDEELEPYLYKLLEWLQDLNWPGSLIILDRLKGFSGKKLSVPFINAFNRAIDLNDIDGLRWLDYLSELLDNKDLKNELPNEIVEKLNIHYHNWGYWWSNYVN